MPLIASDFVRYQPTNSTQGSFTLTAGITTRAALAALSPAQIVLPMGGPASERRRGLHAIPFGTGSNNTTFDYKLWLVRSLREPPNSNAPLLNELLLLQLLGFGTATLGAGTGTGTNPILASTERLADTLTWTRASAASTYKGPGDAIETAMGVATQVYSPADDSFSCLVVPDINDALGVIFETDLTGATDANWLVDAES